MQKILDVDDNDDDIKGFFRFKIKNEQKCGWIDEKDTKKKKDSVLAMKELSNF